MGALSLCLLALGFAPSAQAEAFGGIEGTVTDASSHTPIQGIEVCAVTSDFEVLGEEESEWEHAEGCYTTGADGSYRISGLNHGSYYVAFFVPPASKLDYALEVYNDASELGTATQVSVAAGKATADVDAELSPGAEISGKVTASATGAPVVGADACALVTSPRALLEPIACARSEANGEYTIVGLPSGSYKLVFTAAGFDTDYYNGKSTPAEAELVSVLAPQLTSGIDAELKSGSQSAPPPVIVAPRITLPGISTSDTGVLSLLGKRLVVKRSGYALVRIGCTGSASCRAKLTLSVTRIVTIKGRRVKHTFAIGTSSVLTIAAGKTQTVSVKLDAAVRSLLREHQKLRVVLTLATPGHKRSESAVLVERRAPSGK